MRTINVTKHDIAKGKPRKCEECPIALAASRAFRKPVSVGAFYIWVSPQIELPPKALAFRKAFDKGEPVQPFKFKIDAR